MSLFKWMNGYGCIWFHKEHSAKPSTKMNSCHQKKIEILKGWERMLISSIFTDFLVIFHVLQQNTTAQTHACSHVYRNFYWEWFKNSLKSIIVSSVLKGQWFIDKCIIRFKAFTSFLIFVVYVYNIYRYINIKK